LTNLKLDIAALRVEQGPTLGRMVEGVNRPMGLIVTGTLWP
jgi:hypothetical protein